MDLSILSLLSPYPSNTRSNRADTIMLPSYTDGSISLDYLHWIIFIGLSGLLYDFDQSMMHLS